MTRLVLTAAFALLALTPAYANIEPLFTYKTDAPPVIDGELTEPLWSQCPPCSSFITLKPTVGKPVEEITYAYIAYDSENLYFAFRCHDRSPELIKATLTKRDGIFEEDFVGVVIDSRDEEQFAPYFCTNAMGVQFDAMLDPTGEGDESHDFLYESAGKLIPGGYSVEMKIPLKSLRYNAGDQVEMGIGFARKIVHNSNYYLSPGFFPEKGPFAAQLSKARFTGLVRRQTLEILPSAIYTRHKYWTGASYETDIDKSEFGLTAKYGLGAAMTLDATYNPDFSQIEADAGRVDVNLRFPQFYAEKRPFFMEGLEQFGLAGLTRLSAIGAIVSTRNIVQPRYGLKLTGKVGEKGNLATLVASDQSPATTKDAQFGIVRFKQFFEGDNFTGGLVSTREHLDGHNRVAAIDGSYRLSGTTVLKGNFVRSFYKPDSGEATAAHNVDASIAYRDKLNTVIFGVNDMSKDFHLESGFVPRDGITALGLNVFHTLPLVNNLVSHLTPGLWAFYQRDKYWQTDEGLAQFSVTVGLPQTSYLELQHGFYTETFIGTVYDLDFTRFEAGIRPINNTYIFLGYQWGGRIYYSPAAPYQGGIKSLDWSVNLQPSSQFTNEFSGTWNRFYQRDPKNEVYDYNIVRSRSSYRLNRYVELRGIVEMRSYYDYYFQSRFNTIITDLLASFSYIPGSVIYLGYGALSEHPQTDLAHLREDEQSLFFKASYNWRL